MWKRGGSSESVRSPESRRSIARSNAELRMPLERAATRVGGVLGISISWAFDSGLSGGEHRGDGAEKARDSSSSSISSSGIDGWADVTSGLGKNNGDGLRISMAVGCLTAAHGHAGRS